jgi:hypothetical protein
MTNVVKKGWNTLQTQFLLQGFALGILWAIAWEWLPFVAINIIVLAVGLLCLTHDLITNTPLPSPAAKRFLGLLGALTITSLLQWSLWTTCFWMVLFVVVFYYCLYRLLSEEIDPFMEPAPPQRDHTGDGDNIGDIYA